MNYRIELCVANNVDDTILSSYKSSITKLNNSRNEHPDSGFDLFVPYDVTIPSGKITLIDMRVKCSVTKISYHGYTINEKPSPYFMYARSSVSKRGIMLVNSVGVIDCGYRGKSHGCIFQYDR